MKVFVDDILFPVGLLAKIVVGFFPENFETYVEPFFGAGAVYFDLQHPHNIINDIHPEAINFLQQIKNGNADEINTMMHKFPNDEITYYHVRDTMKCETDIQKAFRFYYLRKTCFRGMLRYNKSGKS